MTGLAEDEWGSVSLEELEDLLIVLSGNGLNKARAIPRIDIDEFFEPTKFSDLPFHKESTD